MANLPFDQRLAFDTELSLTGPFTGVSQLIGTLSNEPVLILFKNQSTVAIFLADNNGSTNGTTMVAGEEIIMDCRANHGNAVNMGFPVGTSFFATGTAGTGSVKISVLYAK